MITVGHDFVMMRQQRVCSEVAQSVLSVYSVCAQTVLRVCSECVQCVLRVCSECVQSVLRVPSELNKQMNEQGKIELLSQWTMDG